MSEPMQLKLKPGGHGVIWKLALQEGVFAWMESRGSKKILFRQINNPIAGVDHGILALIGVGCSGAKAIGIASCPRLINAAEGMLLLTEKIESSQIEYALTNVEYTEFRKRGLTDTPKEAGSHYSRFPANTNLIFADIEQLKKALEKAPLPGLLINMKSEFPYTDKEGKKAKAHGGRLEAMAQAIAEEMMESYPQALSRVEFPQLKCFITENIRRKTISVTKNQYSPEKSPLETPEACFCDMQWNAWELFSEYCNFEMPQPSTLEEQLLSGPAFTIYYHPALGPLWEVIGQKIQGGIIQSGSELQLEIAELQIQGLQLQGSLHIVALDPLGRRSPEGVITYGSDGGKCILKNVTVTNQGIDKALPSSYWSNQIFCQEMMEVVLHGNAEFAAENVHFEGSVRIEVPDGQRMQASQVGKEIIYKLHPIQKPSWQWQYTYGADGHVKCTFKAS